MGKRNIFGSSLRPNLSSSSSIFARRGDPWTTQREGIRDYGRNLETENPERDWWNLYNGDTQYTRARFANPNRGVDTPSRVERPTRIADANRKGHQIAYNMQQRLNKYDKRDYSRSAPEPTIEEQRLNELNQRLTRIHKDKPAYDGTGKLAKSVRNRPILKIKTKGRKK